ncbi:MAG TPA: GNAT family N-acetyltransferase [bacterium]|nr:GNAT family N-acetyltransferase [bacterium]HMW32034.1 GNAT family N-acetyltransferase [bacterium]HMW34772.1 GNAT family N-acetyltransferase [bacterium]HMY34482.1 GNAT family N-acetyltransferase [bacterium]HMZ03355.1 GNAT family N-acetyltransferase [bacterium]
MSYQFEHLTPQTWNDFAALFGERGACGGCWCMAWRRSNAEFQKNKGEGNRKAMQRLVKKELPIGLIMYKDVIPVGWCAFAPREEYIRLAASRIFKPVDEKPVWSISCFFIHKDYRKQGLSEKLIRQVIVSAKKMGVQILEAYPSDPYDAQVPAPFVWTGLTSAFVKAGFKEVARRSKTRPIMRYVVNTTDLNK